MTGSTDGTAERAIDRTFDRSTPERQDWTNTLLEETTASWATLTRRLRAVKRALGSVDEIETAEAFDQPEREV